MSDFSYFFFILITFLWINILYEILFMLSSDAVSGRGENRFFV